MRKLAFIILPCFFSQYISAQVNLIPNGSFETHTLCPTDINSMAPDELTNAIGWYTINETPDYFNICATSTNIQIPNNFFGIQAASSGSAYCGFWAYQNGNTDFREVLAAKLTTTLSVGQKYFVKIAVSLAEHYNSTCGVDKIGVRFSATQQSTTSPPPIDNFSHIYSSSIISDTLNWKTIFGSFTASANYEYVEIGNFFDDANTNVLTLKPGANWAYYYVDDVCISTDSLYTKNWDVFSENTGLSHLDKDQFSFFPNPCTNGVIYFNKSHQNITINVLDANGNNVKYLYLTAANEIDLRDLKSGLYFLIINSPEYSSSKKVIIKN